MGSNYTIAVIGYTGMVGSPIYRWFKERGDKVMGWTPSKQTHSFDEINKEADYIFIAVPTPFNWETNKPSIDFIEQNLAKLADGKRVVIKSTILPGTTRELQKQYPNLNILFNPEFLSAKTNWEDFINPDRQLIGYTKQSYQYATEVLNILPESPYGMIMKSTEAEICKYVNNFHGSLMVIFANFFYDICEKTDADFEVVKEASQASKWVGSPMGRMYWNVFHGGFRGFGGGCFPKDMNSLLVWAKEMGLSPDVLEATIEVNKKLLAEQNMTEEEAQKA